MLFSSVVLQALVTIILFIICIDAQITYIRWDSPGNYLFTVPPCVTSLNVLVVAGGGGGGGLGGDWSGGGGGAGGFICQTIQVIAGSILSATVGRGGSYFSLGTQPPASTSSQRILPGATRGGNSTLYVPGVKPLVAIGGGPGGCSDRNYNCPISSIRSGVLLNGGSGGGCASPYQMIGYLWNYPCNGGEAIGSGGNAGSSPSTECYMQNGHCYPGSVGSSGGGGGAGSAASATSPGQGLSCPNATGTDEVFSSGGANIVFSTSSNSYYPTPQNPGDGGSSLMDGAHGIISISFNATCPPCLAMCGISSSTSSSSSSSSTSSLTCSAGSAQSVPSTYGLQIWPAAHPQNPQSVDLVIAPTSVCAQLSPGGVCTTAPSNKLVGSDGVTRFVIGTAESLNMVAAEQLTCSAAN